ncbi:Hypothetical protein P9303_01761 [Prochlorococcus marinus str. MIT 9303]|uniref:Uncharacterized protein n=1 Tax=Prochlorococcus marinus (strain MIT 9303) TaxID=59922 RepID=A2C621_PROM3|nr:Hypothetical protein P9303_01761 [Prochlorococcus marinus str. MIT 9303]
MGPGFLKVRPSSAVTEDSQRSPLFTRLNASLALNNAPTNHSEEIFKCWLITDGLKTKVLTCQIHCKLTINNRSSQKPNFNTKVAENVDRPLQDQKS